MFQMVLTDYSAECQSLFSWQRNREENLRAMGRPELTAGLSAHKKFPTGLYPDKK
jgi:hypothetical protein